MTCVDETSRGNLFFFGLGLKPMGISLSEAQFSPLRIPFWPFSFLFFFFYFRYVLYIHGSPLIGDDPAEASKERSGSKLHQACQNTVRLCSNIPKIKCCDINANLICQTT